jgi:hypothetical protein
MPMEPSHVGDLRAVPDVVPAEASALYAILFSTLRQCSRTGEPRSRHTGTELQAMRQCIQAEGSCSAGIVLLPNMRRAGEDQADSRPELPALQWDLPEAWRTAVLLETMRKPLARR